MNARKHLTISLALMALALGSTATQASAQPALRGTFELPASAYWGDTLLQAGQYEIWMSTEMQNVAQIHLSGEGVTKTFLAAPHPMRKSGRTYLEVADIGGTYVVRAFDAGFLGKSLAFGVTKNVNNSALRASAKPAVAVPVSAAAGI